MRRCLAAVGLALFTASLSPAKKPSSPLLSQLQEEFQGKEFTTKVALGSSTSVAYSDGQSETRLVDTEAYPNGSIRYLVRRGLRLGGPGAGNFYLPLDQVDSTLSAGTRVRVTRLEMREDRIEFLLKGGPGNAYAKLKVMLGKGFEDSYDMDKVLTVVSAALRLERFEQLQALKAEYPQLKQKLAAVEGAFKSSPTDPRSRLDAARQLQDVLRQLLENRKSYDSLTATLQDPEADQYGREAAELGKTVEALDQEAKKERAAEIKQALKSEEEQSARLKSQLQPKPSSVAEWESAMDLQKRLYETVTHRQALLQELTQLGEPAPAEESAAIQNDVAEGQRIRDALQSQRRALDLADLDARYGEMDRNRKQLMDSYTRAFGTPRQRAEGEKLALHLHQMWENRTAADNLGSDRAKGQAATLQKDIERLKRQIGPVQFPSN